MIVEIIEFLDKILIVKDFIELFKKDDHFKEVCDNKFEKRFEVVLQQTVELCIYRFQHDLTDEMVKYILINEKMHEVVIESLFVKKLKWDDKLIISGYGIPKDLQKNFVEFFFYALQNNMHRDIEMRRALRQTGVYFEIDQIFEMTSLIYNKIEKIDDIHTVVNQIHDIVTNVAVSLKSKNILKLKFFNQSTKEFQDEMQAITIGDYPEIGEVETIKSKMLDLYQKIDKIKLAIPVPKAPAPVIQHNIPDLFKHRYAEKVPTVVSSSNIANISSKLRLIFGITINPNTFFCLGGLKQPSIRLGGIAGMNGFPGIGGDWGYEGTAEEKEKNELIEELIDLIKVWDYYFELKKFFNGCKLIPLVLSNEGETLNENIEIKIRLSKDCEVFYQADIELAQLSELATFDETRLIEKLICPKPNGKVNVEYKPKYPTSPEFTLLKKHYKDDEITKDEQKYINDLFDFSHSIEEVQLVVKFYITSIKPNEKIFLPSYLFVKSEKDIEVQYELLSKQNINNEFKPLMYRV